MTRQYSLSAEGRAALAANAARGTAAAQSVDSLINRLVAKAPPLTDAQRARLAVLLRTEGGASECICAHRTPSDPESRTVAEAAAVLGITTQAIYDAIRRGDLVRVDGPGPIRVTTESVEKLRRIKNP